MQRSKYTREILIEAVNSSRSMADVLRFFGLRLTGGSHRALTIRLKKEEINTSHFHGSKWNVGENHQGGPAKKPAEEILVLGNSTDANVSSFRIRRALREIGRLEICEECNLGPMWKGRPLRLQIDHRNGRRWDNRRENVRWICPNCHSQTENFGSKNRFAVVVDLADTQP